MRVRIRASLLGVVLPVLLGTACTGELPSAASTCEDVNALALIAQAVPQARSVPCFPQVPFGYRATTFDVEAGEAHLALSHAVIGPDAVVLRISETCPSGADDETPVPTPEVGERVDDIAATDQGGVAGRWVQGLGGACLVVEIALDHPDGTRALADLDESWTLMTRQELSATLSAETDGRLSLDP